MEHHGRVKAALSVREHPQLAKLAGKPLLIGHLGTGGRMQRSVLELISN